jgi:hypothetical protein
MNQISIRAGLKAGWVAFMRRPWYLMGITLSVMGISILTTGNALFTALAYIAWGGSLIMFMRHFHGAHIVFDDMFTIDSRWIYFAFLGVIKGILIILGFLCFIIPGVYLSIRWIFAEFLVLDKGMRPLEALRASSTMTEGIRWKLFFFMVVAMLLIVVGFFALVIGMFAASVVLTFALIHFYDIRKGLLNSNS